MKPMLAETVGHYEQLEERYPLFASPKLDGIRALVTEQGLVSRNLKLIPNEYTQELFGSLPVGLDGELVVGKPTAKDCFRTTSSSIMSVEGMPDVTFFLFDLFLNPLDTFTKRYADLKELSKTIKTPKLRVMPQVAVKSGMDLKIYESQMLENGHEGVILRCPNGLYKYGRSTLNEGYLLKVKQFEDSEAVIIGFKELEHNVNELTRDKLGQAARSSHKAGKKRGYTLGALSVRDVKSRVEFDIGAGFSASERLDIWQNQDKLMNKIVKYKYFPIGGKEKPRFPVFQGFRSKIDM